MSTAQTHTGCSNSLNGNIVPNVIVLSYQAIQSRCYIHAVSLATLARAMDDFDRCKPYNKNYHQSTLLHPD